MYRASKTEKPAVGLRRRVAPRSTDSHDWWVYSTAIGVPCLMLECRKTGALGIVKDFTRDEWEEAFEAPSRPYRWHDPSRVEETREGHK